MENIKIGRREAITRIGAAIAGIAAAPLLTSDSLAGSSKPSLKPNIVLLIADDMGYGDLGCYGAKDISTPNIDRLASEGVRFTQFYTTAPVCAPMRVSMLTGKYPQRTSLATNPDSKNPKAGLSPNETLLPEVLKTAGYATGLIGKWHLGYAPEFRPRKQGFDEYFGFLSGSADYFDHTYRKTEKWMFDNDTEADEPGYMTDLLTNKAVAFIEKHKNRPFFLYVAYSAPHDPQQAPDEWLKRSRRGVYGAMVENLDHNIGRVLQQLKDSGVEENTLVIFMSDNGADVAAFRNAGSNAPFRGSKRDVTEGGVRLPFIARWPGHIKAKSEVNEPIISMDIYNTLACVANAKIPLRAGIDGKNVLGVIQGKAKSPHDYLFFNYGNGLAVRHGKWKLIEIDGKLAGLYDLETDASERNDLSAQQPKIVKDLSDKLIQWKRDVSGGKKFRPVTG
ncbi:MAG: sulfatase-like hydrolase/transferase [Armatimonadota bacterium]|nr:sulfatase-like hydrolase/transferase [Armatimonadota bacterium]